MATQLIDTTSALSVAVAAYRLNDRKVVKYVDGKPGNKELMYNYFASNALFHGVDAADLMDEAIKIQITLPQQVMMTTLRGDKPNDFLLNITKLITSESISKRDLGIIAWAPKLFDDINKENNVREQIVQLGSTSHYIGKVGDKATVEFTLITCKYLQQFNSYVHRGHDNFGNLISFFNKNQIVSGKIMGKIKSHTKDTRNYDFLTTNLNYVKIVSE